MTRKVIYRGRRIKKRKKARKRLATVTALVLVLLAIGASLFYMQNSHKVSAPKVSSSKQSSKVSSSSSSSSEAPKATSEKVYALTNTSTGENFYTASLTERGQFLGNGWADDGVAWIAPTSGTPVYRAHNPKVAGEYFYSTDKTAIASKVESGWKWDNNKKAVFYSGGGSPVYVAFNPNANAGTYNFTINSQTQNSLVASGWQEGAVAFNALSAGTAPAQLIYSLNFPTPEMTKIGNTFYMYSSKMYATSPDNTTFSPITDIVTSGLGSSALPIIDVATVKKIGNQYVRYANYSPTINAIYASTSSSPTGPFVTQKPVLQVSGYNSVCYDPQIYQENGKNYMVYVGCGPYYGNTNGFYIVPLSSDGLSTAGNPTKILAEANLTNTGSQHTVERPWLVRAPDGTYVLFYSANWATRQAYYTGYATSKSITGPYVNKGAILTAANMQLYGPGEESVFTDGSNNYLYFNAWIGPHDDNFNILPGGSGRYVYRVGFTWANGHTPMVDY